MFQSLKNIGKLSCLGMVCFTGHEAFAQDVPFETPPTLLELQAAVGSGAGTYIDITNDVAGDTNNGITGIWSNYSAGDWGFPDTSDNNITMNGNVIDDKGNSHPLVQMDFSGLVAGQSYNLHLVVVESDHTSGRSDDFQWGTDPSTLFTILADPDFGPEYERVLLATKSTEESKKASLVSVKAGVVAADASGLLSIYLDNGTNFGSNMFRTEFDGLLLEATDALPPQRGDTDGDFDVDLDDYFAMRDHFGVSGEEATLANGDVNFDGIVDIHDLQVISEEFPAFNNGASLASSIPEPSAMALLVMGGAAVLRRRR